MTIEIEFYKSVIAGCFPDFTVNTPRFIGGSWCRVFVANEDTWFRFPHSDKALEELPRQREIYEHIVGRMTVPVPRFTLYSTGYPAFPYPVAGYSQVPGVPLGWRGLTSNAAHHIRAFLKHLQIGDLSGIMDFELSHIGDPVVDFIALRGEQGRERTSEAIDEHGGPPDAGFEARLEFWSRVYAARELAYGIEQKAEVHILNGKRRLTRAMAGDDIIGGWGLVTTSRNASWRGMA
ncbi:MAG: hypothetical protein EXR57_04720 [Dehalococcoidia bacterium]|nr:hypothetical protein [Dehalococcoidia bacterium]MSQ35103.1 hypothetical protein [Dehalococcoidia bacterium]